MTASQTHEADKTAMLNLLNGIYEAWEANDADAFVAGFAEEASAILPGSYRKSREEVRESMKDAFSTYLKGSTTTNKVLDLRSINYDTAVVITETGVLFPGESAVPADRLAIASYVLAKREGEWLLVAYQNSPAVAVEN